jgi:hypothetical protein
MELYVTLLMGLFEQQTHSWQQLPQAPEVLHVLHTYHPRNTSLLIGSVWIG